MDLKEELLLLESKIRNKEKDVINDIILLHTKAHLFHNKKMHDKALELYDKYNIKHEYFDNLDE